MFSRFSVRSAKAATVRPCKTAGCAWTARSSVLKPGVRRVVPGGVENSLLYHRISGSNFGLQMPPTGPLRAEQIQIIKAWIERGAEWPDALANEVDLPPMNPKAVSMVQSLRSADRQAFNRAVAEDPKLLNARAGRRARHPSCMPCFIAMRRRWRS